MQNFNTVKLCFPSFVSVYMKYLVSQQSASSRFLINSNLKHSRIGLIFLNQQRYMKYDIFKTQFSLRVQQ